MSASLSQHGNASFDDRGWVGLRCTLAAGCDGGYLSAGLGAELVQWHTRFMLRLSDVSGGEALVMHGIDGGGTPSFEVRLDVDTQAITVWREGAVELVGELTPGLAWHAIELGVDEGLQAMTLWLNGIEADSTGIGPGGLALRELRLGVLCKQYGVVGELDFDEWVVADRYIGPVVVAPTGDHADDPRRWAVVYNAASADSAAWAEYYRQARGVPYANLIGLSLPTDEAVAETQFAALRDAVDGYLERNGLSAQVIGLLVGHGVPGRYTRSDGYEESIAGQLQKADGVTTPLTNPVAAAADPDRPTATNLAGHRLTARIDGPTLADSIALVDRAVAIQQQGLGDGSSAKLWLDAVTTGAVYEPYVDEMLAWAASLDRQSLRLRFEVTTPTDPPTEAGFASVADDGFFWGWRASSVPAGFFAEPAGVRVFAAQLDDFAITAPTLRDVQSSSWAIASLQAGYAAALGTSRPVSSAAMPLIRPFFGALEAGWALGEAWGVSTPLMRSGVELIGDPLMVAPLPRGGWNVYGPFDSLAHASFDTPTAMLREDENEYTLGVSEQPINDQPAAYVVRRVDGKGREQTGTAAVASGLFAPAWPTVAGWSPRLREDGVVVSAVWAQRFAEAGVERVELIEQVEGQAGQPIEMLAVAGAGTRLDVVVDTPTEPTRWCFVMWGAGGKNRTSPWSRFVRPSDGGLVSLAML